MTDRDTPYQRGLQAEVNVLRRSFNDMHTQHVTHETETLTALRQLYLALGIACTLNIFALGVALYALLRTI